MNAREWLARQERARRARERVRLAELHDTLVELRSGMRTRCLADEARGGRQARRELEHDFEAHVREYLRLAARYGRADLVAAHY